MNITQHFINGLKNGYPLCCIIAFCLKKSQGGVIMRNNDIWDVYRPCYFHRKNAISDRDHMLLANNGDIDWIHPSCFDKLGNWKR